MTIPEWPGAKRSLDAFAGPHPDLLTPTEGRGPFAPLPLAGEGNGVREPRRSAGAPDTSSLRVTYGS